MNIFKLSAFGILALLVITGFSGCEKKAPSTQLQQVHWDRDMCARCTMVVSDRKFSVQVIDPQTGISRMFDDIGCALLWFKEEKIDWLESAKFWINDASTGRWIDGKSAFYDTNNLTPMGYGFGAHEERSSIKEGEEVIGFDTVAERLMQDKEAHSGDAH